MSQNLLYYSWNIFLHTEFWLCKKAAWAEGSATVSPCKKKAGNTWPLPFLLPSKQCWYFCTTTKWNSNKGKLWEEETKPRYWLQAAVLSCATELHENWNSGNTSSPGKGQDQLVERYSECLKAWEKQAARSLSVAPDQSPCWLPHSSRVDTRYSATIGTDTGKQAYWYFIRLLKNTSHFGTFHLRISVFYEF